MKKVAPWMITGLLLAFALVFLPSLGSILFLVAAAFAAPINKWQQSSMSCDNKTLMKAEEEAKFRFLFGFFTINLGVSGALLSILRVLI